MHPIVYSRRQFLATTAGLSITGLPLMTKANQQSKKISYAPIQSTPRFEAPNFLGPLAQHLFQPGTLTFVAERFSPGGMDFGMNIVMDAAINTQLPTAVFNYGRSTDRLQDSLAAIQTGINFWRIHFARRHNRASLLNDYQWKDVRAAEREAERSPLGFFARTSRYEGHGTYPGMLLDEGIATVFEKAGRLPLALIVVSGLVFERIDWPIVHGQPIKRTGYLPAHTPKLERFCRSLRSAARFLGAAVLVQARVKVEYEEHPMTGYYPKDVSDLEAATAVNANADAVIFVHCDENYNRDAARKGIADIIVAKNLNGITGSVEARFVADTGKLSPI